MARLILFLRVHQLLRMVKAKVSSKENSFLLYLLIFVLTAPLIFSSKLLDIYVAKNFSLYFLVIILFLGWLLSPRKPQFYLSSQWPLLALLATFLLLATVFSVNPAVSLVGIYYNWQGLLMFFVLALVYFLALQINWDEAKLQILLFVFIAVATSIALVAVVNFGYKYLLLKTVKREAAVFPWPTILAFYLGQILPLALVLLVKTKKSWQKLLLFLALMLIFAATVLTFSRTSWILSIMMVTAVIFLHQNKKLFFTVLLILLLVFVVLAKVTGNQTNSTVNIKERALSVFLGKSYSDRLQFWKTAVSLVKERPFFGFGPDTFRTVYTRKESLEGARLQLIPKHPHNFYLFLAATAGMPTLLLFIVLYLLAVYQGFKGNFYQQALSLSLINSLFFNFFIQWPAYLLATSVLFLAINTSKSLIKIKPLFFSLSRFLALLVSFFFLYLTVQHLLGNFYFTQGKTTKNLNDKFLLFQQATKTNPYVNFYWLKMAKVAASLNLPYEKQLKLVHAWQKNHSFESRPFFKEAWLKWYYSRDASALKLVNKALKRQFYFFEARLLKVEILLAQNRLKKAKQELKLVAEQMPTENSLYLRVPFLRGMLYLAEKSLPKAKEQFNLSLKHNPNAPETHAALAELYLLANQKEEALKHADLAVYLNKFTKKIYRAHTYFLMGRFYSKVGNLKQAQWLLKQAVTFNPKVALYQQELKRLNQKVSF